MTKVKANRNGWVFDFSSVNNLKELKRVNKAGMSGDVEELVDIVREFTTAWPLDGDVNDYDAWEQMSPGHWMEVQEMFKKSFNNFLEAEKRRR